MRRVLRILPHAATVLFAALCVATVAMWVRSYHYLDSVDVQCRDGRLLGCQSFVGRLDLSAQFGWPYNPHWQRPQRRSTPLEETANSRLNFWPGWHWLGFEHRRERVGDGAVTFPGRGELVTVTIPFWFLFVATVARPLSVAAARLRARGGAGTALCPACGYDLRATPERCPECGRESTVPS